MSIVGTLASYMLIGLWHCRLRQLPLVGDDAVIPVTRVDPVVKMDEAKLKVTKEHNS